MKLRLLTSTLLLLVISSAHAQNTSPFWSLSGNSNASTSSKLGTTNSIPLRILTNNTPRIYITPSAGYVGVGTTSPTERLHVNSALGKNALRVAVNGSTKILVHSNGGVLVGTSGTPPVNGLYVRGRSKFANPISVRNGGLSQVSDTAGYAVFASGFNGGLYAEAGAVPYYDDPEDPPSYYREGKGIKAVGFHGVYAVGTGGYFGKFQIGSGVIAQVVWSGVEGHGGSYGMIGTNSDNVGVLGLCGGLDVPEGYGYGKAGVLGQSPDFGVIGLGSTGIYANGSTYAGWFEGPVLMEEGYVTSDRNLKKDITEFSDAMDIIGKLKPRHYSFKEEAKLASLHLPKGNHYGLIAQDVAEVLPNLVKEAPHKLFDTTTIQAQSKDSNMIAGHRQRKVLETMNISAVNYIELIPIMIKGMQEQEAENQALKAEVKALEPLKDEVVELRQMVLDLKNGTSNSITINSASLEQNNPNPVSGTTSIRYHVPETSTSALLNITNAKGQVVKTFQLASGSSQVQLNTSMLVSGTYNYSLVVDGKPIDTKRLVIAR